MRPGRLGIALPAAAAAALALAAPASAAPRVAKPRVFTIEIRNMKFAPPPAGLRVGDQILWVNHDMFRHTATAADHSFDVDLQAGQSGRIVLRKPGAIAFTCKFHPGMKGVLTVGK
ncbi:MAG TPA: cupredoxin domain-containing protein [Allosphingosinicella sp.]|nr:cupredoxin domain-containing protein [Allosphingosinicella sp.]